MKHMYSYFVYVVFCMVCDDCYTVCALGEFFVFSAQWTCPSTAVYSMASLPIFDACDIFSIFEREEVSAARTHIHVHVWCEVYLRFELFAAVNDEVWKQKKRRFFSCFFFFCFFMQLTVYPQEAVRVLMCLTFFVRSMCTVLAIIVVEDLHCYSLLL